MSMRPLLPVCASLLLGGCLYHAGEQVDDTVCTLAVQPFDRSPAQPTESNPSTQPPAKKTESLDPRALDVQTTAFMQADQPGQEKPKLEPKIPPQIPGSEAKPIDLPKEKEAKLRAIKDLYPELPALPDEPAPLSGPEGRPYSLADLQRIAAENSPELRQAAADVIAARGYLIQSRAYPNPIVGYQVTPSNDGSTAGLQGPFVDQKITFAGKIKLASAAAEVDLANAELALRRARSDLATRVRNAYYAVLVARETVRVNKAMARFTDEIYRLDTGLLEAGVVAPYEPMALRSQAYIARLAYKQAIQNYIYSWKQMIAAVGIRQLPLSEVAGRIDALIPYYNYDQVLAHALRNHTDVLTARNGLDKVRYSLKLAQITPYPDLDVNVAVLKEYALAPKQVVNTVTLGVPLPIWDQNKGNILAAEAAQKRASEEPHRVEKSLTSTLASAYAGYKTNLDALEYYRKFILPDQVRAYRGVLARRQLDPNAAFADLVSAQQTLATDMTTYLGVLGALWSSAVSVADLLQTDDLFQLAQPRELPRLPDLDQLPAWPCCHDCPAQGGLESRHTPCATVPLASAKGSAPAPSGTAKTSVANNKPAPAASKPKASTWVERNQRLPQSEASTEVVPEPSVPEPSTEQVPTLRPTLKTRKRQGFAPSAETIPTMPSKIEMYPPDAAAAKPAPIP